MKVFLILLAFLSNAQCEDLAISVEAQKSLFSSIDIISDELSNFTFKDQNDMPLIILARRVCLDEYDSEPIHFPGTYGKANPGLKPRIGAALISNDEEKILRLARIISLDNRTKLHNTIISKLLETKMLIVQDWEKSKLSMYNIIISKTTESN